MNFVRMSASVSSFLFMLREEGLAANSEQSNRLICQDANTLYRTLSPKGNPELKS